MGTTEIAEDDRVLEDDLVTLKGDVTESRKEYLDSLQNVVTHRYLAAVQKELPWLEKLRLAKDDDGGDWFAIFTRDGVKESCHLGGTTFPQFPDDFVKHVKKYLASKVDLDKMDKVATDLDEWDSGDSDDDDDDAEARAHDGADDEIEF